MKNILLLNCTKKGKPSKPVIPKIFIAGVFQKIADFKKVQTDYKTPKKFWLQYC